MAQLKMYWFPGTPIPELNLPDGYSVSNYKDESDIEPWVKCCANGLVDEENGRETFKSTILDMNYLDPCRDVFFLDYYGEHIGTVTAFKRLDTGEGDMHMVAIRTDFRGRGLSKYLSIICCAKLEKENCKRIFLTTDEWRKGAVKGYLNAGFLPVKYDIGMEDRWCKELEVLGVDSVKMVNDDGTDYKVIYRQGLRSKKPVMGIQLYTLRDYIKTAQDFDKTLARLKSMGVNDVQISAIGDFPAEDQAKILTKYNINCCVTHKSFDRMLTDLDNMILEHRAIGCDAMGIGSAPSEARGNAGNIRRFIEQASEIGKKLSENGMTFNYHNHDFEFNYLDDAGCSMMDLLIEETDPELFHFIPDVAWIDYAGSDPVQILNRLKGRVKVIHFKDYIIDNSNTRRFVSLGKGCVDLKACYEAACENGVPYIMYEQDCDWVDGDAFKACEESWDFMQSLQ